MLAICSHEHFHENIPSLSHARYPLHVYSETSVAYRKQPVEGFYRAKWSIITTESSAPKNPLLDGLYRWPRVREKHLSGHHRPDPRSQHLLVKESILPIGQWRGHNDTSLCQLAPGDCQEW